MESPRNSCDKVLTIAPAFVTSGKNGGAQFDVGTEARMRSANEQPRNAFDAAAPAVEQALKYAEDIVKIYEEEKTKRKALELVNAELAREIAARKQAEAELQESQKRLEKRVLERTAELTVANERLQAEVEQRRQAERTISASLREKEVLLQEIHHRVKNNLQIICSLIALQSKRVMDETILDALKDTENRIRSMALIHEQLYRAADFSRIEFAEYIESLIDALISTHCKRAGSIEVITHLDKAYLGVGVAPPCSLIINELVTNCLKHAFPKGRKGQVKVEFRRTAANSYMIVVADNGVGLPEGLDIRNSGSLGLQLVVNLAELQLRGRVALTVTDGTAVTVEFHDPKEVGGREEWKPQE